MGYLLVSWGILWRTGTLLGTREDVPWCISQRVAAAAFVLRLLLLPNKCNVLCRQMHYYPVDAP